MSKREPLLTTPQVARMISKSTRTVHRAVDDHELKPAMQVGEGTNAPYLFEPAEVARWIAKRAMKHAHDEQVPA
jgi:predicted DNA-binding transcriptional regulator AlpA